MLQMLGVAAAFGSGGQNTSVELSRKAVFIERMLGFVQWPDEEKGSRGEPFRFCVVGDNFLSFAVSQQLHGTAIQGREIAVRSVKKEGDLEGCDATYFAGPMKRLNRFLKLKGTRVLTLGEDEGFLDAGGMVQIFYQNDAVQFEVNLDCVRSAGLKIDARLLELAKGVKRAGRLTSD